MSLSDWGFTAHKTGYAGLAYTKERPGLWRFWDVANEPNGPIGDMYPTKDVLLADLRTFAESRGYEREA